jgi:hypothetical protein
MARRDFRADRASNEPYQMVVWPRRMVPVRTQAATFESWIFSFLDHDAF